MAENVNKLNVVSAGNLDMINKPNVSETKGVPLVDKMVNIIMENEDVALYYNLAPAKLVLGSLRFN